MVVEFIEYPQQFHFFFVFQNLFRFLYFDSLNILKNFIFSKLLYFKIQCHIFFYSEKMNDFSDLGSQATERAEPGCVKL